VATRRRTAGFSPRARPARASQNPYRAPPRLSGGDVEPQDAGSVLALKVATRCARRRALDAGRIRRLLQREDRSGILSSTSPPEAWGARYGFGSRELAERAGKTRCSRRARHCEPGPPGAGAGRVLIKDASGAVLGAVGISGDARTRMKVRRRRHRARAEGGGGA